MFDKLVGKKGLLWQTGDGDDAEASDAAPAAPSASAATNNAPAFVPSAASVDPEILAATRKATFEIAGSVYARFAAELENIKDVIQDPTTRIKAVVKMLRVSPAEIAQALSTTHAAALQTWKATVARAKDAGQSEKIGARQTRLQEIEAENRRIQDDIARLQKQLQDNAGETQHLQGEIAAAQSEIDQKTRHYDAAFAAVEAELGQIVATLKTIT